MQQLVVFACLVIIGNFDVSSPPWWQLWELRLVRARIVRDRGLFWGSFLHTHIYTTYESVCIYMSTTLSRTESSSALNTSILESRYHWIFVKWWSWVITSHVWVTSSWPSRHWSWGGARTKTGDALMISDRELTTTQNSPVWINLSSSISASGTLLMVGPRFWQIPTNSEHGSVHGNIHTHPHIPFTYICMEIWIFRRWLYTNAC